MSPDAQERLDARERLLTQLDLADAALIAGLWSRAAALMELVAGDLHIADRPSPEAGAGWRGIGPKLVGAADFDARGFERARQMLREAHDLEVAQLRSLAHAALDEMEEAWRLLREALIRTHSAGSLRHLLDEGEALARMLRGRVPTLKLSERGAGAAKPPPKSPTLAGRGHMRGRDRPEKRFLEGRSPSKPPFSNRLLEAV